MRTQSINTYITYALLILVAIIILVPIAWIVINSLKYFKDIISFDYFGSPWTLYNYEVVLLNPSETIVPQIFTSVLYIVSTIAVVIPLSMFAGYALARLPYNSLFRFITLNFFIFSRVFPATAIAVPYFAAFSQAGLYDNPIALIFVYILRGMPLAIFMIMTFISEIPKEVEEAALIDGVSTTAMITKIILPLIRPGLAATAIFVTIYTWNDFTLAAFLAGKNAANIQIAISQFNAEQFIRWGELNAAVVIAAIPVLIFLWLIQKHLIRGLTFGAVKA